MSLTLSQKLERFPPIACRLLARRRSKANRQFVPLSDEEIAERAKLKPYVVRAISFEVAWDHIPVSQMVGFMRGCGIDIENSRSLWNHWRYLKSRNFKYLRKSPEFETLFLPLAEAYRRATTQ